VKAFLGGLDLSEAVKLDCDPRAEMYDGVEVLCRGYIANPAALMQEAQRRGETLVSGSDAELFAKAYGWWRDDLQSHVLGEFAVVIFDPRCRTLFLAHDAMGLVPLFYSPRRETIAFGSHLEHLLTRFGIGALDEEYVADYLATGSVATERTPYIDFRRLLPGESLKWVDGRMMRLKTWDIARVQPITLKDDREYEEHLRRLLDDAVTAASRADGNVWVELSGGLDSSTVACVAAHLGAKPAGALSIVYSTSSSADERKWINTVVQERGLPWFALDADEARPFSELPDHFCAEPAGVLPFAGLFRRYKDLAEANNVRVVLTGYGGDQIFCGGSPKPYYIADHLPFRLRDLLRDIRAWQAGDPARRPFAYHLWRHVLIPSANRWMGRSLSRPEVSRPPAWIRSEYGREKRLQRRSARQVAPKCGSVGLQYQVEAVWKIAFTAGDDVTQGFEFRHPLLYRPLVEFMLAIPWKHKFCPESDRVLQRRALAGILPAPISARTDKAGPAEAEAEGLRHNSPWAELLLRDARVVERGYVDARAWTHVVNQMRFGRMSSMRHFIATAALEIWLRQLESFCPAPRNNAGLSIVSGVPFSK